MAIKKKVPLVALSFAMATFASATSVHAENPILDLGECLGVNSRVAMPEQLVPEVASPDDPESGFVDDPLAGAFGVFVYQGHTSDGFLYDFTGKTSVWNRCDGIELYDVSLSVHPPA